jgi:hypothetical protein
MISYCHLTGARRAVLVFPDTAAARPGRRYVFPVRGTGEPVEVAIACLRTDATSVSGWRAAGRKLVEDVESLWPQSRDLVKL